ncbi:hypothetical protein JKF63_05531 [Porcisia hertigi]|uniref:Major facilitator superfamily (MFS) profile domain-containing protein n=1 Tax=Porcisia hertigi TaxID=2761500 RepID=A0A836IMW6_9TRYP|nr:hypothetical protein JKF63_05531 [Porcisia hertigi]
MQMTSPDVQAQQNQLERFPVCASTAFTSPQDLLEFKGKDLPNSQKTEEANREDHEADLVFKTTPFRFIVLGLFAAFGFINQIQYVGFTTIIRETESFFGVNAFKVNVLSLLVPMVYVIGVIPGCYLYNKVGLRYGLIIGTGLNATASVIKFIAVWAPKYPLLAIAQVLVAGGQILFLSLPTLVAGIWFPSNERTVATSVASLFSFFGMAVGMFYPPYVISLPDRNTQKEWGASIGSQCAFSILVLTLTSLFVSDKPKYRPSVTSDDLYKLPLLNFLKSQLKDLNFLLLAAAFGLITGSMTAIAAVMEQLLRPFGIEETTTAILAFTGILGGALNCALVGRFVGRTHYYKYTAIALATLSTSLLLVVVIGIKTIQETEGKMTLFYVLVPVIEFLVLPLVPVVMELGVELAYPCPETVPTTIVLGSMCFFSLIGTVVFSLIIGVTPTVERTFSVVLVALILSAISTGALVFVKETLRRKARDEALGESACDEFAPNHGTPM